MITLLSTVALACATVRASPKAAADLKPKGNQTDTPSTPAPGSSVAPYSWEAPDPPKENVDGEGQEAINKKRWVSAAFFNRVREKVRDHWQPGSVYRRLDPDGSKFGKQDRYTLLEIELDSFGSIRNVSIAAPSGISELDTLAVEAFTKAAPFSDVPEQLRDASGGVRFRFGFAFELSEHPERMPSPSIRSSATLSDPLVPAGNGVHDR